jgi:predicted Fe-S protein YdhL (DUF1289 family)
MQANEKLRVIYLQIISEVDKHWVKLSNAERHELTSMLSQRLQNRVNADALCHRDAHVFSDVSVKPDEKDPTE